MALEAANDNIARRIEKRMLTPQHHQTVRDIANWVPEAATQVERFFEGDSKALRGISDEDMKLIENLADNHNLPIPLRPAPDPFE